MMQLIDINDLAVIDINKKMSTIGESLETTNLTLDSQNENKPANDNVKTINGMNQTTLNINGIVKIKGAEIDEKTENDQDVVENKIETNGQNNGNSVSNMDCKISAGNIKILEKNLDNKEEIMLTYDLKVTKTKSSVEEISSEMLALNKTKKTGENTPTDIDILIGDNVTASPVSAFSPNSQAGEKEINISSQLQQLENDASIDDDVSLKSSISKEINKEIVHESTTKDISLKLIKENRINSLLKKEANDELVTNETEQLSCKDSPIINAKNKGISEVSKENESIVDVVKDDGPVIIDNTSQKVDHVIIDEPSVEEASNLPLEELLQETKQKETMDIDDKQIDLATRDDLKSNTENNGISEISSGSEFTVDLIKISDNISANVDKDKTDKQKLEKASNIPLTPFEKSDPKEIIDYNAAKERNYEIKLDKNDEMLKNHVMDVDDTVVCTLEKHMNAAEIMSDHHDSIKNGNKDKSGAENDVGLADTSEERNMETSETGTKIPSKEVKLNQNDKVVMDINVANEMSVVKSALRTDVDRNEINIETKTDDALAVNLDAVVLEQKQKVIVNMDIDDVEVLPTVVSTLVSDVNTKEIKSYEEVPTEQVAVVCLTDKNGTNVKQLNLIKSVLKEADSSEVISREESENDANQDKPIISICSVAPEEAKGKLSLKVSEKKLPMVCKLSNTMDILSDDEDEPFAKSIESKNEKVDEELKKAAEDSKCINLDDDDDIMFIEDTNSQEPKLELNEAQIKLQVDTNDKTNFNIENKNSTAKSEKEVPHTVEEGKTTTDEAVSQPKEDEIIPTKTIEEPRSIITKSFLQSVTKNLADMTRNELEDFCILKLVESVVDKSNLNEIKSKMKTMTQTLDDLRKKTMALTKQNRDLQVVVKTVQEEQKKRNPNPMMPMKITRSVGMQVVLTGEKCLQKRKPIVPITQPPPPPPPPPPPVTPARPIRTSQSPKNQPKPQANIPVPRLVPASSPTLKLPATPVTNGKVTVKNVTPQRPEKRPHNKTTSPPSSSVTVDLTDDEPPSKIITKNPTPPVRLVPSHNLMPKNRPQFTPNTSNNSARESPRKVYIPICSNAPRPAVGKNFASTPRSRPPVIHPSVVRMQGVRMNQVTTSNRHPAPLPDAMKQYQPPAWKALPPAPDLKLSKVDNGIVISWKFEGYETDSYEEVASFQLYAYQETPAPPSTALWKKIGDIKALPLPMACTLTQFMSGFKYYFAVRAIDVRSRIGPFSLPGSIMLISKN